MLYCCVFKIFVLYLFQVNINKIENNSYRYTIGFFLVTQIADDVGFILQLQYM